MFDRAFVVNLNRCHERLLDFQKLSDRLALPLERWPAVDGKALSPRDFPACFTADCKISGPAVGACLSQIGIWREALRRGYSAVAVFEDDATTALSREELTHRLADAQSVLPPDWDMLYLGKCCDFCKGHRPVGRGVVKLYRTVCMHAYVITAAGMRKLLAALPMNKVGDEWVADLMEAGRLEAFAYHPSIFTQNVREHASTLRSASRAEQDNTRECVGPLQEALHSRPLRKRLMLGSGAILLLVFLLLYSARAHRLGGRAPLPHD